MYSAQRVDPKKLFVPVRQALTARLEPGKPLVVAQDDTRLRKTGRKTHGVKYMRDPMGPPFHTNLAKAQRFLQMSMASAADNGMARMIPIDFCHAPVLQKPPPNSGKLTLAKFKERKREMALSKVASERLRDVRNTLDDEGERDRPVWAVVDGGFTNRNYIKALPPRTVMIGRIRSDAKLYYLPQTSQGKPGRNRVYGEKSPTPDQLRQDPSVPWQQIEAFAAGKTHRFKIKTLSPLRWRPAGKDFDLRLIVIAPLGYRLSMHSRVIYRKPAYLICTDPCASVQDILQAYIWRWDIEVNFRDEKTLLGVGQAQVRDVHSVENVPALAVAAYAMLLTSSTLAFGPSGKPDSLKPPKWHPDQSLRPSTQSLLQHLRHEVWANAIRFSSFVPTHPHNTMPQKLEDSLYSAVIYAKS